MKIISFVIAAVMAFGLSSIAAAQSYSFIDLGGIRSIGDGRSDAMGLNNSGQVAGNSNIYATYGSSRATRWDGLIATDLGTLGSSGSYSTSTAFGINNFGWVVGEATTANNSVRAALWKGNTATNLGTAAGFSSSYAAGINDAGQVVGRSSNTNGSVFHATLWNGTEVTDLGTLGGNLSVATAINNSGQIVGYAHTSTLLADDRTHATLWNGTSVIDLGALGGVYSEAAAINDNGMIVGFAITGLGQYRAVVWDGTTATALDTLGRESFAYGLNNSGVVVGESNTASNERHAVLWRNGSVIDLNSYLDASAISAGWLLVSARDINDAGAITGTAWNSQLRQSHAFVLNPTAPIPEPETYAMMLAGLGLLGLARRRKQNA